jgi:putative ABC transport system permease protein
MSMLRNYLITTFNVYMRRKLYTAINLACITLTLVVLMVITALLQNAFFPTGVEGKSERFLQVFSLVLKGENTDQNSPLGFKVIDKYLRPMRSIESIAAVTSPAPVSVYHGQQVSELQMRYTDAEYWRILDFVVLAGRVISTQDVAQGKFVAVLNQSSALKFFPNEAAVGQSLNVAGQQFQIIGVVEDVMHLNAFSDLWIPVTTQASSDYENQLQGSFSALLLAKTAADIPAIQAEVLRVAPNIAAEDPKRWQHAYLYADSKLDVFARALLSHGDVPDSGAGTLLLVITLMMLLFMLLPALNLVNLNIGRIMERGIEIGVRKAFGASSNQLVLQLVIENVLLSLLGGALALVLAKVVLLWLGASGLIPYLQVNINFSVFALGLALTIIFGLLSGVVPAWKMSRLAPVLALKGAN